VPDSRKGIRLVRLVLVVDLASLMDSLEDDKPLSMELTGLTELTELTGLKELMDLTDLLMELTE